VPAQALRKKSNIAKGKRVNRYDFLLMINLSE